MLSLLLSMALADVAELDVPPAAVTVYSDRARVTRSGVAQLGRGVHELVFVGLPATADSSSLTADLTGSAELLGIDVRRVSASESADVRVAELDDRLQDLRDTRQDRGDDLAAAQARLEATSRARTAAASQLSLQLLVGEDGPAQLDALRRRLAAEDTAARTAMRTATLAMRELDEQIGALERERASLGSSATDTLQATVRVDVLRGGAVEVDLTYNVGGARWRPRYDLRGDAATGEVELALSAMVSQTSGEDWSDVTLSVSSAQPGRGTDVPQLDPFWLAVYRPQVRSRSGSARPMAAMAEMSMDAAAAPAPPPPPMEVVEAQVETQLAATTFRVRQPEDLASDGTERKVLLTTEELESTLRHVVVPRLDPTAYLVGEVTNTADFPLLPGEAGVFVGDTYVGDIVLDSVPVGERFGLSFGPDERVQVRRTREATTEDGSGPIGRRRTAEWEWSLAVRSSHPRPVQVRVMEQVPLSPREDVQVAYELERGPASVSEKDGGLLHFDLPVAARGSADFTWSYSVTYPGDLSFGWME